MIGFMGEHREEFGVEPMCRVLNIAPSTWHAHAAARANPDLRSKRAQEDERLSAAILRVHAKNFGVYGCGRSGGSSCGRAST
jgi:putative transposase